MILPSPQAGRGPGVGFVAGLSLPNPSPLAERGEQQLVAPRGPKHGLDDYFHHRRHCHAGDICSNRPACGEMGSAPDDCRSNLRGDCRGRGILVVEHATNITTASQPAPGSYT